MTSRPFHDEFVALFEAHFARLHRYFDRLSGDPDLAADLVQGAFVKLYQRGQTPDSPGAWLVTVAANLLRNTHAKRQRRARLLTEERARSSLGDPPPSPADAGDAALTRSSVRRALARMPERERSLLLLRAEGYSYRELAAALALEEGSVGTLLARAKRAFRELYQEGAHAP